MIAVRGRCGAEKYKRLVFHKIEIHSGLNINTDILNFTNDGCNTMKKFGRLVLPILMQLCLSHVVHLSVVEVFFKKKVKVITEENDEQDENNDDESNDVENDEEESNEDEDDDDSSDSEYDDDDDDLGIVEIEEIPGEFSDAELATLIEKCRKIVKTYCGRSTINVTTLQDAVKDWQKKNNMTPSGYQLATETKTRWNSTALMLESILKIKTPLKKVLKDSDLALSELEFVRIREVLDVLMPVKVVVEALCREDADLMVAETAFNELFKSLKANNSFLATKMLESLRKRVKSRWNPLPAGLLKFLHNPKMIQPQNQKNLDEIFKAPSQKKLEEFAIELLCHHYGESVSDENPVQITENETKELSFAEKLQAQLDKLSDETATKKLSFQETIKKEMELFKLTNERSKNLSQLYMILQNISPTSVASERAFSNSNDFVTKKRCNLSDKSVDNLCFLKSIFKN